MQFPRFAICDWPAAAAAAERNRAVSIRPRPDGLFVLDDFCLARYGNPSWST